MNFFKMRNCVLVVVLLFAWEQVRGVLIEDLQVPTHLAEGGEALLGCQFDMEGQTLYSVKWYKNDREFFRYLPKSDPPVIFFPTAGVVVDVYRSSSNVVNLINLSKETAGDYRCEVSGEGPYFPTASDHKYITMHLNPEDAPHLTGLLKQYRIGDMVSASCTSLKSRPETHLKWLINERPAPMEYVQGPWFRVSAERPDATDTVIKLRFRAQAAHFHGGAMSVKCQATIAPLYQHTVHTIARLATPSTPDFLQFTPRNFSQLLLTLNPEVDSSTVVKDGAASKQFAIVPILILALSLILA